MRLLARWPDRTLYLTVRRIPRWLWPFSDSVTFWRTILTRLPRPTRQHLQHEATHSRQYEERGWWWVWTHPRQREAEARAAETAAYPEVEVLR